MKVVSKNRDRITIEGQAGTLGAYIAPPKTSINSIGLELAQRYHGKRGLAPNPSLFERSDSIEVLEGILPRLPMLRCWNPWDTAMAPRDIARDDAIWASGIHLCPRGARSR